MDSQVPAAGTLSVDHVAHFVPQIDAASTALERLGFTLTPFSPQSHRLEPGGPLVPAGTGNRCVMLEQGYLEFLTPTGESPIARQLRTALERYVGVHLIAFGTAAPEADRARLARAGFEPLAPVALQREIETMRGAETAHFTVVRVPPNAMAEGRIQFCQHHTPDLLWQPRWRGHANRARALIAVVLCVDDPSETAQRYARFTGLSARPGSHSWRLDTARGTLWFVDAAECRRRFGAPPPALPWIAGYVLLSKDYAATLAVLRAAQADFEARAGKQIVVRLPPALGGIIVFAPGPDCSLE